MAQNDATFTIGADPTGLLAGLEKARQSMESAAGKMGASLKPIQEGFKGVGASINDFQGKISKAFEFAGIAAAAAGIRKVGEMIDEAAARAERFQQLSQIVGATTTEFQGLAATAAEVGVNSETLQRGLMTLSQHMTMARDGSKAAQEQMAKVGITAADLANPAFTAASALYTVAKSGAAAGDVQVLLGQKSTMLMAAFGKLAGGQKAMEEEARKVGALNKGEISTLQTYRERVAVLGIEYQNLKGHVAAYLINASGPLLASFDRLQASFGSTAVGANILKGAFAVVESAVDVLIDGIRQLDGVVVNVVTAFVDGFTGLGKILKDVFTGNWSALKTDGKAAFSLVKDDGLGAAHAWAQGWTSSIHDVSATWKSAFAKGPSATGAPEARAETGGGGTGGISHSHGAELAGMRKLIADKRALVRKELAEMTKEMNQEVEVAKVGYKAQYDARVSSLDRELAAVKNAAHQGELAPEQAFVREREILQEKLAAQTEYYTKLKMLAVGNRLELAKIDADEQKGQLAYLAAVDKAHRQTTQQIDRQWSQVATKIGNTWSGMIDKMLAGTMNWHQMFQQTMRQMLTSFIRTEVQMVVHHVAAEAAKAEASTASAVIQQTASQNAAREGILQSGMAAVKKIMNDAYSAAAAAYKATVGIPGIGPFLAPAAAAGAFAAVSVFGSSISSAAGGYDIPGGVNPMTQLHAREMVLPSHIAEPLRQMVGAGGGSGGTSATHNWNISTVNSRSIEQWARDPDTARLFRRLLST